MRFWAAIALITALGPARAQTFPAADRATLTPERQGLSSPALDAAAAYAEKYGGGSGCVVRHGVLVKEWGDPKNLADIKSATNGSFGATALGLAVDRGLVKLDDLAQKHYPTLGTERPENNKDWLAAITIRQLATMTAGFDDGRPPKLVYRPGTKGISSNDTTRHGSPGAAQTRRADRAPLGRLRRTPGHGPTPPEARRPCRRPR
ncbi:MAG TPA: serine hydrolase [Gemmataceae bacterium]|jgi:CubicO group peptidase (beta-lactamase class C family)|nr:serine hydrolase [Gemmataceae bacterium]